MTGLVFVDANVFLYALDPADPLKRRRAVDWLDLLWRTRRGRISTQVLNEFYTNATKKFGLPAGEAWNHVQALLEWQPHAVDAEILVAAREIEKRYRLSWWDSVIAATAQAQSCEILLTEDLHDGSAIGTLIVRSPFTLQAEQPAARYEAAPMLASLHRPRGRPRRSAYA